MRGAIPSLPNTPSWRGTQLKVKHRDNFTLVFSEAYKLRSSSLCSLLQPPATSSHLGPNILITLFSNNPNVCREGLQATVSKAECNHNLGTMCR
jgi:hypothetical protein